MYSQTLCHTVCQENNKLYSQDTEQIILRQCSVPLIQDLDIRIPVSTNIFSFGLGLNVGRLNMTNKLNFRGVAKFCRLGAWTAIMFVCPVWHHDFVAERTSE